MKMLYHETMARIVNFNLSRLSPDFFSHVFKTKKGEIDFLVVVFMASFSLKVIRL